ncbi:MAG: hypothetical protein H0X66_01425 [Verrucomicrobia bacterium]|nr:hypothetical protein [Verrucomicrobiota bacterium]
MKKLLIVAGVLCAVGAALGVDVFPKYSKSSITAQIPTNTVGYIKDAAFELGTNVVYTLNGQIFINSANGNIQTVAEGFSGATDKSTPWKTLTELLAVYQQGVTSNKVAALYTPDSQEFLDEIFTDAEVTTRFKEFSSSITNMQVLMGFDLSNGFYAITSFGSTGNPPDKMPFFLSKPMVSIVCPLMTVMKQTSRTLECS